VRTSFYNFVYTGNLFNLREGEEKRKRKRDHKVSKIGQQNNRGTLRDINVATAFCIHFPHKVSRPKSGVEGGGGGVILL
jgi:hypothetical protein